MKCVQCGMELKKINIFCPFCGKELEVYQGIKYISKEKIDDAFEKNDFDFLWKLFDSEQAPYAEYKYEKFILSRADKIDTPSDFKLFINKIKTESERGSLYAKYLYGRTMRSVFRERGILEGIAAFMGDRQKYREGTNLVKEAAANGQTSAEWTMGKLLWEGDQDTGIAQNEREAYRYINRAAQKGHPMAMLRLGEIYMKGMQGLDRNVQKAEVWMKAAAYFDCKTKENIQEKKYWVKKKDVKEVLEFYGLGKSDLVNQDAIYPMHIDFSTVAGI